MTAITSCLSSGLGRRSAALKPAAKEVGEQDNSVVRCMPAWSWTNNQTVPGVHWYIFPQQPIAHVAARLPRLGTTISRWSAYGLAIVPQGEPSVGSGGFSYVVKSGSARLREKASACALAKLKAARQGYEATLKDIENTLETKEAELAEKERLIKASQSSLAEQQRELAAREAALKAKEAKLQQDNLRDVKDMGHHQSTAAKLLAESAKLQHQGLLSEAHGSDRSRSRGRSKDFCQGLEHPAHRAHSNPAGHAEAMQAPAGLQRSQSSPPGIQRTSIQPSDWGLRLLKQLSGDKSAALPQNLMRRRMRGNMGAAVPDQTDQDIPVPADPAAAAEQEIIHAPSEQAARQDSRSAAEPGAAMDWTAEPGPEAGIPSSATTGSRPPLPKLRVKLGGVRVSGGSSQRATASPHFDDDKFSGPAHATPRDELGNQYGEDLQLGAEAAAAAKDPPSAEATPMAGLAAATPAPSNGSENMLFRLADAASMDVDLEGSVGSPPTVQSRKMEARKADEAAMDAAAVAQTPASQVLVSGQTAVDASDAASVERRWRLSGAPPPGTKPQPVKELPKAVLITSPNTRVARPARSFSKHLDYKSCQHILCLTKDMARHLLPPAPQSATHA
ncbi:hypothetical protein WJX84_004329, partial [Apatococcus fuscideae]